MAKLLRWHKKIIADIAIAQANSCEHLKKKSIMFFENTCVIIKLQRIVEGLLELSSRSFSLPSLVREVWSFLSFRRTSLT